MKSMRLPVTVILLAVALAVTGLLAWGRQPAPEVQIVLMNDIVQKTQEEWGNLAHTDYGHESTRFTVTSTDDGVLHAQGEPITTALAAARARALTFPVMVDGEQVGVLYIVDDYPSIMESWRRSLQWGAFAAVGAVALAALAALWRVHRRMILPFRKMRHFATQVAAGDLDVPLRMDSDNAFGAFTESFDVMRTELLHAREREQEIRDSKQELVAQLSHDIRTPVASILAAAEVLTLTEDHPTRRTRLVTIAGKAMQIDDLLTDLFSANETDLRRLPVTCQEYPSSSLLELLKHADINEMLVVDEIPESLVSYDQRRLQQVLDNVVTNSYKYAGTPISTYWELGETLSLRLSDSGPGVPESEVHLMLGQGIRGTNSEGLPGQGLGLFTCATLMERMGGDIHVANTAGGFAVTLELPLA